MHKIHFLILTIAFLILPVATTFAQKGLSQKIPGKQEVDRKEEIPIVIGLGSWRKGEIDSVRDRRFETLPMLRHAPIVLKSAEEASKFFKNDIVEKWATKINFDDQVIFVWSWRGSGQDKMEPYISHADPKKVLFYNERGFTKDLAEHLYAYAVRKDIKMPGVDVPTLMNSQKR